MKVILALAAGTLGGVMIGSVGFVVMILVCPELREILNTAVDQVGEFKEMDEAVKAGNEKILETVNTLKGEA